MADFKEAAECAQLNAPYLAESLALYPGILEQILELGPEQSLKSLFSNVPEQIAELSVEMALLRKLKRKAHLIIALSDISRFWDWSGVTEHLTQLADLCLQRILVASAESQGVESRDGYHIDGLFILAVGKYGARELNYSSDVDFNVFYDPDRIRVPNPARAERTLIKIIQGVVKGMEAITEHGYIFRTDLRLRPDPRSNAIAVSTLTAERYYETLGQNWERAAMIKARVCAGDMEAGENFIETVLRPFIWRKNMDFAAIEDILAIKRQIHSRKDVGRNVTVAGHHLKLGVGGIREIEFYAQVQQLILGGRYPELRSLRTVEALARLADGGFIQQENAALLTRAYSYLRTAEHAVQMVKDEQTHSVPEKEQEQGWFAALMGESSYQALSDRLSSIFIDVRTTYQNLFPEAISLSSSVGNLVFTGVEPDPDTLKALKILGFTESEDVWLDMAGWLGGRVRATRSEKARELLTALAPRIIENCAETGQADKAFGAFRQFFTHLKMGVSLLSMFHQRPEYLKFVISLMTLSPMVTDWIAKRPSILDAMADPDFLKLNKQTIIEAGSTITKEVDFETALNHARRWAREARFRISTALLSQSIDHMAAGQLHTDLADSILSRLLPVAIKEAERRTGKIAGEIAILGMGKLATGDLNLGSDLDIMIIYEPAASETNAAANYTRVTQRLVSALSSITEEGGLYEVDMALRPSGRSGPVAVSSEAFRRYYAENAWTWEFMALTRSRVVTATSQVFMSQVQSLCQAALKESRSELDMPTDIADMLMRLRREKPMGDELDLKNAPGGIRDIEFIAQKLFLMHRFDGIENGMPIQQILEKHGQILKLEQVQQLVEIYDYYLSILQQKSVWDPYKNAVLDNETLTAFADYLSFENKNTFLKNVKRKRDIVQRAVDQFIL